MDSAQMNAGTSVPADGRRGISGSTFKIIAVTAMLIDHIAAVILTRQFMAEGYMTAIAGGEAGLAEWISENGLLYFGNLVMRMIGRLGFPIFCFLLTEGFQRSRDVRKYALRLGVFALVSEIPFDLATTGNVWNAGYQNVYFTLLLGLLALCMYGVFEKYARTARGEISRGRRVLVILGDVSVLVLLMLLAELLQTDYGGMGVLTITAMYLCRKNKVVSMLAGCVVLTMMSLSELPAFLALIPAALYNGSRGLKMKYLFYAFYPVHLLLLYLLAVLLGLGGIILVY